MESWSRSDEKLNSISKIIIQDPFYVMLFDWMASLKEGTKVSHVLKEFTSHLVMMFRTSI